MDQYNNEKFSLDEILAEYRVTADNAPLIPPPAVTEQPEEPPQSYYQPPRRTPTEKDIRDYMSSLSEQDFLNLTSDVENVLPDHEEIDSRFNIGGAASGTLTYNGSEVDTGIAEGYTPPVQQDYYTPAEEDTDVEGGPLSRRLLAKLKRRREVEMPPASDGMSDEEFSAGFRDYGAAPADYAEAGEYEQDFSETYEKEDFFPQSFKEYILSALTTVLYGLRKGVTGSFTMEDSDEDYGPEFSPMSASKYYGSFLRSMKLRVIISAIILVIMCWVSLGLPVIGMLAAPKVAAMFCLGGQFLIMLLGLDSVTVGIMNAVRGRPGADSMAVIGCIITMFDAILVAAGAGRAHVPFCALSSLSLLGVMTASWLSCRGLRKSLRVPAIGKHPYAVTGETDGRSGTVSLLKSLRPFNGFVRRAEEAPPDETLFIKLSVPFILFALLLSLIVSIAKKSFSSFFFILSAIYAPAVHVCALLCFALPFFLCSGRIFSSGAAIAGWSGMCDIGTSKNLVITDRDLFPEGSIELTNVRIFADMDPAKIISYAATMLTASGSCVSSCFAELMEKNGSTIKNVQNFEYLAGGGMKGIIDGSVVLCGSTDLMKLMNVRLPFRLVDSTSILIAVDGILYGIFSMNYTAQPQVRSALVKLMRSNRHPVFAVRDFNITPEMLHQCFDVPTDGYDFPPYVERFKISEAKIDGESKISAVICREGLGPLTHMADTGRSMYVAVRLNLLITAIGALIGMLAVTVKLLVSGFVSFGFVLLFMLLWALPVAAVSLFMK